MTQSRRMLVLRAVVEDYIRSQEPVGSTSLTRDHDLGVSSATIRNDMAALEDEGYLIQPHTSAGRVPTEKGYRYFVDRLATVVPLSEAQRRGINSFLSGSVSLKDALQRSARLLSEITGQVAVVASPSLAKATLRHVEMVPVAMTTLLAVVITDTGRVAQHGLTIASMPAVDEINRLSNTVNEQCDGLSLSKSAETVRSIAASAGYESVRGVADALADAFESMALDERANELYMSGTSHLAHSRSLADLAPLFDALEEPRRPCDPSPPAPATSRCVAWPTRWPTPSNRWHWTNARTNCTCPAPRTWPTPGPWPIWPRSSTRWKNRSC